MPITAPPPGDGDFGARFWLSDPGGQLDIAVGDIVITDDQARWRVYAITRDGSPSSFVALHLASPTVLAGDVAHLRWSETESVWRLRDPGAPSRGKPRT